MKDEELLKKAWNARKKALPIHSSVKVGCAILTDKEKIVTGYNIEGLWMTSIHAEVSAIVNLVKLRQKIKKIAIVAETEFFTPCGACIDWIMQFGNKNSIVIIQNKHRQINKFKLSELAPHYPEL